MKKTELGKTEFVDYAQIEKISKKQVKPSLEYNHVNMKY